MRWYNTRLEIRMDRAKDGHAPVRLVITINKERLRISLGFDVPLNIWDHERKEITGKTDEAKRMRLMLKDELLKADKILYDMHQMNMPRTTAEFMRRYEDKIERNCFIKYFEQKAEDRYIHGEIKQGTYRHTMCVVNKLAEFNKNRPLSFQELNMQWLEKFRRYVTKSVEATSNKYKINRNTSQNTVNNYVKKIRAYTSLATQENLIKQDPFYRVKLKTVSVQRHYLSKQELYVLIRMFMDQYYPKGTTEDGVLKNFLLMCSTGLRVSDAQRLKPSNLKDGKLTFTPIKTNTLNKVVTIALNQTSKAIIDSYEGEKIYHKISDQKQNEILKQITKDAGFRVPLTNHVGRHTFATIFLQTGGKIEVLQELLGHTSITTTMQYSHVLDSEKVAQLQNAFKLPDF